jgi:RNA polymerase sigma-70 factor, ECF subfamily
LFLFFIKGSEMPVMSEIDLVKQLKSGDKQAFGELVDNYSERVINTCYRFLMNREDAEDISQEVFIEVYQSIRLFRGDSKLSTWIYRIAVTKSLDEIKKRKRKKRILEIGHLLHIDDVAFMITGGSMPDRELQENERMNEVLAALDKLPDNQRIAFTLCKLEGYSNSEIAEIMKTTLSAVESLISRAKRRAGAELELILKK